MLRVALLIVTSVTLTALPAPVQAQRADSAMRIIRARYKRINDNALHYQQYETSLDSIGLEHWPVGRGRLTATFEADTLRSIVASYAGTNGHATVSYYFWDGAPFEIRARLRSDDGKTSRDAEQRFYFYRGYLVKWVDPGRTIHPVTTGAVFARAMQLMADATRLIDAARRERERSLAPTTPVDIADAMRRQLSGLVSAELAYYAEKGKYSKDFTTVGYRPAAPVQITLLDENDRGLAARATTPVLPGKSCVVYVGQLKKQPKTSADHVKADSERVVMCDRP